LLTSKVQEIYSENGLELSKLKKDILHEIKPVYAIKNFDLAILETAFEKGFQKYFGNER